MQATDPNGIETLVENPKRREKTSHADGQIWIGNVIHLRVIKILADRAAVWPTAIGTLELSFKFRSGFDQPTVSQRKQKDRINLCVDLILPRRDEIEIAGTPGENRNRAVVTIDICFGLGCFREKPWNYTDKKQPADKTKPCLRPTTTPRFQQILQTTPLFRCCLGPFSTFYHVVKIVGIWIIVRKITKVI